MINMISICAILGYIQCNAKYAGMQLWEIHDYIEEIENREAKWQNKNWDSVVKYVVEDTVKIIDQR